MTSEIDVGLLESVQRRVLWLATRMIDHANHDRAPSEIKVGGHQASSASMVSIMTSLWFAHLSGEDKVAIKPHASPVYHAIKYLTGELDRSYLTRLRSMGGLQAYPSRTKDPDVADFSTGSVGLGVVAPLFAAAARRYVETRFGPSPTHGSRFIALAGDAELDEGNVWEAITDPSLRGLANFTLVVDTNRQSLDRVIPGQKIKKLMEFFEGAGWHVIEAKYGTRLEEAFAREGGDVLRRHIDDMSNEEYQSLFAHHGRELRSRFSSEADPSLSRFLTDYSDDDLERLVHNLGGHDMRRLVDAYRSCDTVTDRPSVIFAYTIKGFGLPIAGDPMNHAALLNRNQIDQLRASVSLTLENEWDRFDPESPEGRLCDSTGGELNNRPPASRPSVVVPRSVGNQEFTAPSSTQEHFGRLLVRLAEIPDVGERMVTTSPDVSISTNLGGWINKVGVFDPDDPVDYLGEGRLLRWKQSATGQHIELGISEMNLFLMLHALGLGHELHGQHLLPIGTVYDPFVCRGLDALVYGLYNDSRFVVVGTPAGVTLAPEGGAHQSSITPSIGLELPGLTYAEPAYARALDWILCQGLADLSAPNGGSLYLRLSTRPIDQTPFATAAERIGVDRLRESVLRGGYRLHESDGERLIVLATCGPVVPEVLEAADLLEAEGVGSVVLDITSSDRLYRAWIDELDAATRSARRSETRHHLADLLLPDERRLPIVTIHDAASHHLAWLGGVFGAPIHPVGVDRFGQSGTIDDLYEHFSMRPDQIVNAALVALG